MRHVAMLAIAILVPGAASGHQLTGPPTVLADATGHFAYELTLVVESVTELAWYEIDGSENTDIGHLIFDGFCLEPIEPGTYPVPIAGNLLDPETEGVVHDSHFLCDGWEQTLTTTILPQGVAAQEQTWSGVKCLFH